MYWTLRTAALNSWTRSACASRAVWLIPSLPYRIKLEGARLDCHRAFVVAGVRDPLLISQLSEVEAACEKQVRAYYENPEGVRIRFLNYGVDGVMGALEPMPRNAA